MGLVVVNDLTLGSNQNAGRKGSAVEEACFLIYANLSLE